MTLLERDPRAPHFWRGNLPVTSRYTYGLAGERFFREIKKNARIMGTHCSNCEHTYVPAVIFCERCMNPLEEWVDVGTVGEVFTFTFLYENYDGSPRETPEVVAFIKISDGGLVHRLGDVELDDVQIGMVVEAKFKSEQDRVGSILDIEYFCPADN